MPHPAFEQEFDGLVEKFAELLTGSSSPDTVAKVKLWSIYNHIHKTMPQLASHWSKSHPEARAEVRRLFEEIRDLNQTLRTCSGAQEAAKPETAPAADPAARADSAPRPASARQPSSGPNRSTSDL